MKIEKVRVEFIQRILAAAVTKLPRSAGGRKNSS
jgi:hypothetical protein